MFRHTCAAHGVRMWIENARAEVDREPHAQGKEINGVYNSFRLLCLIPRTSYHHKGLELDARKNWHLTGITFPRLCWAMVNCCLQLTIRCGAALGRSQPHIPPIRTT